MRQVKKEKEEKKVTKKAVLKKVAEKPVKKALKTEAVVAKAPKVEPAVEAEVVQKPKKDKRGKDTGSVEVQIDNFSTKIDTLAKHLKKHAHDFDSRRGLLIMVGKRRRLLNYVKKTDEKKYDKLIAALKLKK
jgi:small subunit ribosomal protein S15